MTVRYNAHTRNYFAQPPLPSGFESSLVPPDFTIPACGIRDVDKALFDLFDKEIGFQVSDKDASGNRSNKRVPIMFEGGEKWALLKNKRENRDRNNTLVLPLIAVVRTNIKQDIAEDINGRGINQQTGEITIKRRLDSSDRDYQKLVNRLFIRHQSNLAWGPRLHPAVADSTMSSTTSDDAFLNDLGDFGLGEVDESTTPDTNQLSTLRFVGDRADEDIVQQGGLLAPNLMKNVYEFITIPTPQFFTATYTVTMWTQYTSHMNSLVQQLMSSFLPQGNSWRLDVPTGYWFVAHVDANNYDAKDNLDDFSTEERILKYEFTVTVPAYELASKEPGQPIPIRRFVSSPEISFSIADDVAPAFGIIDPFLGADDPTLPITTEGRNKRADQRDVGATRLYPNAGRQEQEGCVEDPALKRFPRGNNPGQYKKITGIDKNGKTVVRYVRIVSVNKKTGETVLAPDALLGGIEITLSE